MTGHSHNTQSPSAGKNEGSNVTWKPIDTAPKDSTRVLVFAEGEVFVGEYWGGEGWYCLTSQTGGEVLQPSLWTEIPELPSGARRHNGKA